MSLPPLAAQISGAWHQTVGWPRRLGARTEHFTKYNARLFSAEYGLAPTSDYWATGYWLSLRSSVNNPLHQLKKTLCPFGLLIGETNKNYNWANSEITLLYDTLWIFSLLKINKYLPYSIDPIISNWKHSSFDPRLLPWMEGECIYIKHAWLHYSRYFTTKVINKPLSVSF